MSGATPAPRIQPPRGYRGLTRLDDNGVRYVATDTRGRTLWARFRRNVWWELKHAAGQWLAGFPCNVIRHSWTPVPWSHRTKHQRDEGIVPYQCKRCPTRAGWTTREERAGEQV